MTEQCMFSEQKTTGGLFICLCGLDEQPTYSDGPLASSKGHACLPTSNTEHITDMAANITLYPKTGFPLLSRVQPGYYMDGNPPGKTRLLLEEVLARPAGGVHPVACMGPNAPV